mmetsp:Transcript_106672/g.299701  ORF Transcript_106672/g.299701 Transcript_106672/m.299701 type:complete len:262 (-) Transcript_106672:383-1168(-)
MVGLRPVVRRPVNQPGRVACATSAGWQLRHLFGRWLVDPAMQIRDAHRRPALHLTEEACHDVVIGLDIGFNHVVVARGLREVRGPTSFLLTPLEQSLRVVERHDLVSLPVQYEHWALDRLDSPVVREYVEATNRTRRAEARAWVRINHFQGARERRVQDESAQRPSRCQLSGWRTANALPVGHDRRCRDTALGDEVVGRLHVAANVGRVQLALSCAIASVLHPDNVDAEGVREFEVVAHHDADVAGVAVAVQQDQWRLIIG